MAAKRKPYESPMATEVTLAPDEAVLAICKDVGTGNWGSGAQYAALNRCQCPDDPSMICKFLGT